LKALQSAKDSQMIFYRMNKIKKEKNRSKLELREMKIKAKERLVA